MDATKGNMYQILNGFKQFIIPVYQRLYSWDEAQCNRLWQDIVAMQKNGRIGHFVGSIVNIAEVAMPTGVQKFMIIDGQQRMTTLTLLLVALRDYAVAHPNDTSINAPMINSMCLKNDYQTGDDRYKLFLTAADRDTLIQLIEAMPIPEGVSNRIVDNYRFFAKKVAMMEITPAQIYESIGKLQIVNITLDRQVDDPQAIFESLNSTGKELSESDLIRNYVLMGLDNEEQTYVYENLWRPTELLFEPDPQSQVMDKFFRDYLTMKQGRIPNINRVYETFKQYHLNCEFTSVRDLCQDLFTYARIYTDIFYCRSLNKKILDLYNEIRALQMEVTFPFLLRVHSDRDNGFISDEELCEIMKLCISYIFRRAICAIPTNSLNKTFATLKNEIRPNEYLTSIKAFFVLRESYKVFPGDERFIREFTSRDIYNMRIRNYILNRLENHGNKNVVLVDNLTIEHIMPQNPKLPNGWREALGDNADDVHKRLVHTIGNLTLTAYNPEMSDASFADKLIIEGGLRQSGLRLNSYVIMQNEWNERTITERSRLLGELALKIWPYPSIDEQKLQAYITPEKPAVSYSLESYEHLNAYNRILFEKLHTRIANLGTDVRREFKKLYVAYKRDTNFVDIVIQKRGLRLSLNIPFHEISDPTHICRDITGLGRWGNGETEVYFESLADLEDVMNLIQQSYQWQE